MVSAWGITDEKTRGFINQIIETLENLKVAVQGTAILTIENFNEVKKAVDNAREALEGYRQTIERIPPPPPAPQAPPLPPGYEGWEYAPYGGYFIPSKQTGGLITETGPYLLHKGERVLTKREAKTLEVTMPPGRYGTVNINLSLARLPASRLEIQAFIDLLEEELARREAKKAKVIWRGMR